MSQSFKYMWLKFVQALQSGRRAVMELDRKGLKEDNEIRAGTLLEKAQEFMQGALLNSYMQPMTDIILFTGPAMAPTLNRKAIKEPEAEEFIMTRKVPIPGRDTVRNGDVVAFKHPLRPAGAASALMVRRVAASGGEMLHSDIEEYQLSPDVVWVLADNQKLAPPNVEDSRSFGPVPLSHIVGRCIYAIRSRSDRGPIKNHVAWEAQDQEVVRAELTEELLDELGPATSAVDQN